MPEFEFSVDEGVKVISDGQEGYVERVYTTRSPPAYLVRLDDGGVPEIFEGDQLMRWPQVCKFCRNEKMYDEEEDRYFCYFHSRDYRTHQSVLRDFLKNSEKA